MIADIVVVSSGELKMTDDRTVSGRLIIFGNPDNPDLVGDYFDRATDYGKARETYIWLNHTLPVKTPLGTIHIDEPIGEATIDITDEGVVIEGLLMAKYRYLAQIADQLGWSSGTAAHLVRRTPVVVGAGKSVMHIDRWPLGLDASLTPTPAEPRTMRGIVPLKMLVDAGGGASAAATRPVRVIIK